MRPDEALARIRGLGFSEADAQTLFAHFDAAERRGKEGHGYSRIVWLETQRFDAAARPLRISAERWDGNGALGYLTLAAVVDDQLADPPQHARVVVASRCFPTGMLGHYVRRLADAGLVAALTATSPARLAHPDGGPPLVGTNPLAIGVPGGIVVDVSMGKVTYGDVLRGAASESELVPFGGEQSYKAFALALGLQLLVDALAGPEHGAVLVVARPEHDPVPDLRERAAALRLPGG